VTTDILFENSFTSEAKRTLETQGYVCGLVSSTETLLSLASDLGSPVPMRRNSPIVDFLTPTSQLNANPNSLSSRHGLGSFPFHTDCASWLTPARYIILRLHSQVSDSSTVLVDCNKFLESPALSRQYREGLFKVVNGKNSFLAPILNDQFIRIDQDCMEPANRASVALFQEFSEWCEDSIKLEISWEQHQCVVIDNWRVVHSRKSASSETNSNRTLNRVLVSEAAKC
jgi:L-asparagine oxygenase